MRDFLHSNRWWRRGGILISSGAVLLSTAMVISGVGTVWNAVFAVANFYFVYGYLEDEVLYWRIVREDSAPK